MTEGRMKPRKSLDEMTKPELIKHAEKIGLAITYIGQREKGEILRLIREAQRQSA